jgi:hypothetical protein
MNWINPRHKLPVDEQLIWALFIENRAGEQNGFPSASAKICKASIDMYGVVEASEITHKGFPEGGGKYFFEWWHSYQEEDADRYYHGHGAYRMENMIIAWIPFESLPAWTHINIEESKRMIIHSEQYKKGIMIAKTRKDIEKARGESPYFIQISDRKPIEDGVYVVANKDGVWLCRYEQKTCSPWIAPNGSLVDAWYPVPNHY